MVVTAAPESVAPPPEPRMTRDEALARGRELRASLDGASDWDTEKRRAWIHEHDVDEVALRRALEVIAEPCLAQREPRSDLCKELDGGDGDVSKAAGALIEGLAEGAEPRAKTSPSVRLLVRLEARGVWAAERAIDRVLTRRMLASAPACSPPTDAELREAGRALDDFAVGAPGAARWPSAAERDDLAYFYASIAGAGAEVGVAKEDLAAKPLPNDHPDLAARAALRTKVRDAHVEGNLELHLSSAIDYLRSLGYPAPLRLAEEGDERWGGAGASFIMRDAARSAEILGNYEVAEALYRRANPGGGMCGTSVHVRHAEQMAGVIRVVEQARGCRAAAVERLSGAERGHREYGPERLSRAGFDVARLYAGALLTLGRDDPADLERALLSLPSRSSDAIARLRRIGPEAWATRVRAISGYADTAGGAAMDRLLDIAEHGPKGARVEALTAIGFVAEDRGDDPCVKAGGHFRFRRHPSSAHRDVRNVMQACETRIGAKVIDGAVRRIAALAADPEADVREAVAHALGHLGATRARDTLKKLARDTHDAGGRVCTKEGDKPEVCEPNRPVARAAREGLSALDETEKRRAQQKAKRKR